MAFSGKHTRVQTVEEVTYGTNPGTINEDIGLIQSVSESSTSDVKQVYTIGAVHAQQIANLSSIPKVEVTYIQQHGRNLKYLLGDTLTEATTTGDTVHTWAAADVEISPPSCTMEVANVGATTVARIYKGGVISAATIGLTKESLLQVNATYLFQDVDPTAAAANQVTSTTVPLKSFQGAFKVGGSAVAETQSWEITIDRKVTTEMAIGSRKPIKQDLNEIDISGKAVIGFADTTQYENFLGAATGISSSEPSGLTIDLNADNGVALGSGQRKFNLQLTSAQYSAINVPTAVGDFIFQDVTFTGKFNSLAVTDAIANY